MKLARLWIQDCRQNHDTCKAGTARGNASFRPTRLIDIKNPLGPFLQETSPDLRVEYIALSYAWGQGKKVVTNKENYDSHKQCIPPETLPRTFADAFQTARQLGFQYIWVDAFCIKQGDGDDLSRELPKMGDIYRYAVFTIFAEGAPSAAAGLFQVRDPYLYRPCSVDVTTTTAEHGVTSGKLTLATVCTGHNYLKARGWVLQEEVLASRSLLFGKQMSWKCTASEASETRPLPLPRRNALGEGLATSEDKLRLWLLAPTLMMTSPKGHRFRWNQYDAWYAIIEEYSVKELSFDTDKLPALSGLAGLFHEAHGSTYAAGLWKEDLQFGLAWYVASNDSRPVKGEQGRGPSWSWASVGMARLKFRSWRANSSHVVSAGARILDYSCELDTSLNPYGNVKQGTLKLQLRLKRATLRCSSEYVKNRTEYSYGSYSGPDSATMTKGEHPRFPARVFDSETSEFIGEAALDAPIHARLNTKLDKVSFPGAQDTGDKDTFDREVWCGLLHVQGASNSRLTALVFEKIRPEVKTYRRVGLLFLEDCSQERVPLDSWQEAAVEVG
ncbi:hypothetical protein SLS62_007229 [Diatrype stigma]|uniref:Heterokaryon incompatibility domain-containing protein n=1 Tax=Diatrype stigma TaxID=117547 RepID=A0AAN9YQX6_9PEZI